MRVVIVKTSAFGDVVQALAVAQYLKEKQNICQVDWVVEESVAPLVQAYPYVDTVLEVNSKKIRQSVSSFSCVSEWCRQKSKLQQPQHKPWDVVFDLQGNTKSMLINLCLKAKEKVGYGWRSAPERLNLLSTSVKLNPPQNISTRDEYLWLVQSYFNDAEHLFTPKPVSLHLTQEQKKTVHNEIKRWPSSNQKPVWVISTGSRWINKTCSAPSMLHILERANEQLGGIFFVFVAGSYQELKEVGYFASRFLTSSIVLFKPDLAVLAHLIARADRVIAMDSLVLHLSSLTHTPTFSFFGPSNSTKYAPQRAIDGNYQGACPLGYVFNKRCPQLRTCATGACLKEAPKEAMLHQLLVWNDTVTQQLLTKNAPI